MMKKKYQNGGGLYKGYPKPERQPIIKQGYKGAPTQESIREDIRLESRQNYEKGAARVKASLAAASNVPVYGKFAQALSVGADVGTGIAKKIRGEKGASKDFAQAGVGTTALLNPAKGFSFKGIKRGVSFLKAAELSNDVSDIAEGAKTYKRGGKMPLKKASGKGKAAVQKAVSANIQELTRANRDKPAGKKRSKEQIAAIAYSAARKK